MWLGIACLVVATGTAGGAYLYFHESVAAVAAKTPEVGRRADARCGAPRPTRRRARHRLRPSQGRRGERVRALGHADARARRPVYGLDLPPVVPTGHAGRDPLSGQAAVLRQDHAAYATCGPQGSLQTVRALTGVQMNYLITVNFRGFRQIVDRLDGAWIDVDRRYFNDRSGPYGYAKINLRPGYQQLTGRQTLDYVRYRHTDSDLYRVARQQQFVKAFKTQIQSSFAPLALPKVVNAITKNVQVAQGGGRDVPVRRSSRTRCSPTGCRGASLPDADRGARRLRRSDDGLLERHAGCQHVHASGRRVVREGDRGRARREGEVAHSRAERDDDHGPERERRRRLRDDCRLPARPALVPDPDAAERAACERAVVRLLPDPGLLRQVAARRPGGGQKVANLFASAELAALPRQLSQLANGAMLVVIVGQTFHGTLAAAPIDTTPKRERPNVILRAERLAGRAS